MSESFWDFSLRFYRLQGVAETCLDLQDRHDVDVNMVLFVLWAASRGQVLDAATIAATDRTARPWRETVTQPLRAARRALKTRLDGFDTTGTASLRQQVMAAELDSERLQQAAMAAHLPVGVPSAHSPAAQQNLHRYEALVGKPFGAARVERLLHAFDSACDGDVAAEPSLQAAR
jgi:uncharacterized protein (TIGR02444 family)